ncbi:unnamed protein product [Darwinula stevensoni]|uniref:Uncharacterized protein n=1 Tax=Darwinula stevensoni TaxID=69355 RepID=A0A7R8XGB8_9CRUS|nr:unnamed protein product [Darwinula stevensoni]CAG0896122.1 unnamed protein product [Darwinula stevensoni]
MKMKILLLILVTNFQMIHQLEGHWDGPSSAEEFCKQIFNRRRGALPNPTSHKECGECLPGYYAEPVHGGVSETCAKESDHTSTIQKSATASLSENGTSELEGDVPLGPVIVKHDHSGSMEVDADQSGKTVFLKHTYLEVPQLIQETELESDQRGRKEFSTTTVTGISILNTILAVGIFVLIAILLAVVLRYSLIVKRKNTCEESPEGNSLLPSKPSAPNSEQGKDESITFISERISTVSWTPQTAIMKNWTKLIENMDVEAVENYLIEKGRLERWKREELNDEGVKRKRRETLLHHVCTRDLDFFHGFLHGLNLYFASSQLNLNKERISVCQDLLTSATDGPYLLRNIIYLMS